MEKNIDELLKEIETLREINSKLISSNEILSAIAEDKVENTKIFNEMQKKAKDFHKLENENTRISSKIKHLEKVNKEYKSDISKLVIENDKLREKIAELTNTPYIKHPGGRPSKFSKQDIREIIEYKNKHNSTYTELAAKFNCSVGLIHKLLNEKK